MHFCFIAVALIFETAHLFCAFATPAATTMPATTNAPIFQPDVMRHLLVGL
jgi:hypothetical protein